MALNSGLNLFLIKPSASGSVERDLKDMELYFSFVASISDVLSMSPILDILYRMIFRMIWIFRDASVILLGRLTAYCHILFFCTPEVLTQLLHSYCMSFYGCALWNLNNRSIKALEACINKVLRRIWSLPYNCHNGILYLVSGSYSIFNIRYNRFCKLLCSAKISCNYLVQSVFQGSSLSCRNFIGYNFKYGSVFVRNYSCANFSVVNLIREIRDNSLIVYGFHLNMLNKYSFM